VYGPVATVFNHYLRAELNVTNDAPYGILVGAKVRPWEYEPYENRYVEVSDDLREAMNKNPFLRAFFACGAFDLATPYLATVYTVQHLGLPPERRGNVSLRRYAAGHMFYTDEKELAAFAEDVRSFLRASFPQD
jgi:carboxypeptidase C (cathepsin A)